MTTYASESRIYPHSRRFRLFIAVAAMTLIALAVLTTM